MINGCFMFKNILYSDYWIKGFILHLYFVLYTFGELLDHILEQLLKVVLLMLFKFKIFDGLADDDSDD